MLNNTFTKSKLLELKLSSLLEITKAINSNFKRSKLLQIYESVLRKQLNVGKFVLYAYDGGWMNILNFGMPATFTTADIEHYLLPLKDITLMDFSSSGEIIPIHKTFKQHNVEVIIPVFHKDKPLAYALIGDLDEEQIGMGASVKHLNFIQTLTNILVVAIENKRLAKESIRQAEVKKELEVASQMQHMLFPSSLPNDSQLEMDAFYLAHEQIGGDYYDFIRINEQEVAICIADVSGKGISAALLMSNFQANLRIQFNRDTSLTDIIKELNNKVNENAQSERFITLFVAKYNVITKMFTYVNAGHNPPLLLGADKTISTLKTGCTGLGMFEEIEKIREGVITITPSSLLFCYTDGLVEQENEQGEDFGMKRLKDILIEHGTTKKVKDLNRYIVDNLRVFKGTTEYADDIALLSCKIF
ncbi:MAG: PP2C family protein-serine/threonine phosphatase [Bacteroidota bacterium]